MDVNHDEIYQKERLIKNYVKINILNFTPSWKTKINCAVIKINALKIFSDQLVKIRAKKIKKALDEPQSQFAIEQESNHEIFTECHKLPQILGVNQFKNSFYVENTICSPPKNLNDSSLNKRNHIDSIDATDRSSVSIFKLNSFNFDKQKDYSIELAIKFEILYPGILLLKNERKKSKILLKILRFFQSRKRT